MLLRRLRIQRLLSFGPTGVDLPMEPLNVLIGPNGSGKSNFLEAIAVFRAGSRGLGHLFAADGIGEWLWKGPRAQDSFTLEATVDYKQGQMARHLLTVTPRNGRPAVKDERIEPVVARADSKGLSYRRSCEDTWPKSAQGSFAIDLRDSSDATAQENLILFDCSFQPELSLVSFASPGDYPVPWRLNEKYKRIHLYRDWSFGPSGELRQPQSAHDRADFLADDGANLPLVLSHFHGESKMNFVEALQKLFGGIVDISCPVAGGKVLLFLVERGNRYIPATRLSDGTLRYLCLLSILLHPKPPPLVAIEEPELGLHPDLLPTLADLLVDASERTQLVVTTHSDILVDALTEKPESIVVCEKHDGQTEMRRLDRNDLEKWLKDYRLGELWTSGELGGNRW